MNIACIIPAAGKGLRLGKDIPKQYLKIHDIMVIEYAIRSLIDGIYASGTHTISLIIACEEQWITELLPICVKYLPESAIAFVEGGKERKDSIVNALQTTFARQSDKLLIHDAARPFIPTHVMQALLQECSSYSCIIPTLPISDTLKKVQEDVIEHTCDRSQYRLAQTPQLLDTKDYYQALKISDTSHFTDDASIMEHAGFSVFCIPGHDIMRKVTYPYDLLLAEVHAYMYEQLHGA